MSEMGSLGGSLQVRDRVRDDLEQTPRSCDHFDLIGGTSNSDDDFGWYSVEVFCHLCGAGQYWCCFGFLTTSRLALISYGPGDSH